MCVALYFLAALTVLPYALLSSAGFVLLGQAISAGTFFAFLGVLLTVALWLIPGGRVAIIPAFIALLALGISERWRWLALSRFSGRRQTTA